MDENEKFKESPSALLGFVMFFALTACGSSDSSSDGDAAKKEEASGKNSSSDNLVKDFYGDKEFVTIPMGVKIDGKLTKLAEVQVPAKSIGHASYKNEEGEDIPIENAEYVTAETSIQKDAFMDIYPDEIIYLGKAESMNIIDDTPELE